MRFGSANADGSISTTNYCLRRARRFSIHDIEARQEWPIARVTALRINRDAAPGQVRRNRLHLRPRRHPRDHLEAGEEAGVDFRRRQDRPETVQFARQAHEALKSAGSTMVKYTEYPGVPHNSWDKAYAEKELAEWLFSQRRG